MKVLSDSRAHPEKHLPLSEAQLTRDYLVASVGCCPELLYASWCDAIGWFRANHIGQKRREQKDAAEAQTGSPGAAMR